MSPKAVDKEEKRLRIARAASLVFGEKGFERTRMEDVAQAAGVGKGTLYEYFKDKEALLHGSFEVFIDEMKQELANVFDMSKKPLDILLHLFSITLDMMNKFGDDYRYFFEYMLHLSRTQREFPLLNRVLGEFRSAISELIQAAIQDGSLRNDIDVEVTAATIAAWFDGAILHWIVMPSGPDIHEMGRAFIDLTLKGLMVRG